MRKKKRDRRRTVYVSLIVLSIFLWLFFFVGSNITGYSILELGDGYIMRNYDGLGDFTFDEELITIDNTGAKLKFNESNQSYPLEASLYTLDIQPEGLVSWELMQTD